MIGLKVGLCRQTIRQRRIEAGLGPRRKPGAKALLSPFLPHACAFGREHVIWRVVCLSDKGSVEMERPGSYQPLERRKVYEQIAEQLLAEIGSGRLRPGDPLPPSAS